MGHISFSDAKDVITVSPVVSFHRMEHVKARDAHEVMMMLPVEVKTPRVIYSVRL
ncbi:hypothetical protein M405DRAFT_828576 [Rhizopogon salebrosus TDB-379]|nr:hypothetical protein M405DRAFT_828576 [Rhizopogon salebrosus TDB-379]